MLHFWADHYTLGMVHDFMNMSYCKKDGKDEIIFATKVEMQGPSKAMITFGGVDSDDDDDDEVSLDEPGLILPDGEINWNCPCLGGMAAGPCGVSFREAFSCFHFSNAEPKGSDCYDDFQKMQDCMQQYPDLYPASSSAKDDGDGDGAQESVGIASSDLQLDDDNAEKECS